jgi:hypothetical protein
MAPGKPDEYPLRAEPGRTAYHRAVADTWPVRRIRMFQQVVVPGQGEDPTPEVLLAEIAEWVDSEPLQALVRRFGAEMPVGSLATQLAYLDEFTSAHWDFRRRVREGSLERNQIDAGAVTGTDEELAVAVADALGLVRPRQPRYDSYDHVVTLGGLVGANVWRPAYAAYLLGHGISARNVVGISAYRNLAGNDEDPQRDEFRLLDSFGLPQREYEWQVMEDGLRRAFDLPEFTVERESGPSAEGSARFRVASASSGGRRVSLVVAPALEPGRRADTAAGYRYWADQVDHVKPGERILAVTTCIYVPYQHAIALQHLALPFGCSVDTVGVDFSAIGDNPNPQGFRGAHYLLEIRSALLGYQRLAAMLSDSESTANPGS